MKDDIVFVPRMELSRFYCHCIASGREIALQTIFDVVVAIGLSSREIPVTSRNSNLILSSVCLISTSFGGSRSAEDDAFQKFGTEQIFKCPNLQCWRDSASPRHRLHTYKDGMGTELKEHEDLCIFTISTLNPNCHTLNHCLQSSRTPLRLSCFHCDIGPEKLWGSRITGDPLAPGLDSRLFCASLNKHKRSPGPNASRTPSLIQVVHVPMLLRLSWLGRFRPTEEAAAMLHCPFF